MLRHIGHQQWLPAECNTLSPGGLIWGFLVGILRPGSCHVHAGIRAGLSPSNIHALSLAPSTPAMCVYHRSQARPASWNHGPKVLWAICEKWSWQCWHGIYLNCTVINLLWIAIVWKVYLLSKQCHWQMMHIFTTLQQRNSKGDHQRVKTEKDWCNLLLLGEIWEPE